MMTAICDHRAQVNNTLSAQVDLGARATVVRKRVDGTVITDSDELIRCSRNGNPDRNSDPTVCLSSLSARALAWFLYQLTEYNSLSDWGRYQLICSQWGHVDHPEPGRAVHRLVSTYIDIRHRSSLL